jgi:hypothetical protein
MLASASAQAPAPVGILFSPQSLFVIDIFRALANFEEHYELAFLDEIERRLSRSIEPRVAKGLVSDGLLLAFGIRRERRDQLDFAAVGSRRGTVDEYRLLALIGAAYRQDAALAAEAALALGVTNSRSLITLAYDIADRLMGAGIPVDELDERLIAPRARDLAERAPTDPDEDRPFAFERRILTLVVH